MKHRMHPPARWGGVLFLLGAAVSIALPASVYAQDLNSSERQRLFYSAKPATVLIGYNLQAEITVPGETEPVILETSIGGAGSGFIASPDGFVVTNGHVVQIFHESDQEHVRRQLLTKALDEVGFFAQEGATTSAQQQALVDGMYPNADIVTVGLLKVFLQNGRSYDAEVREYSPPVSPLPGKISGDEGRFAMTSGRDVAILKIPGSDLPTLRLGESDRARIGEEIFVAGYPGSVSDSYALSQETQLEPSISRGQVSNLRVAVEGSNLIQMDAPVTYGNSGGPVIDGNGRVLGIATLVTLDARGQVTAGFSFAVPTSTIRQFLPAAVDVTAESLFNTTWNKALDDFYAGNYNEAVASFDEVLRVIPDLPDAIALRRDAIARRGDAPAPTATPATPDGATDASPVFQPSEPESGMPGWLFPMLALGALLVGAGLFMRRSGAPVAAGAAGGSASATSSVAATPALPKFLSATDGPLKGNRFDITSEGIRIGRDPAVCQIVLSDANVSREHAILRPNGAGLVVKNLSGTNPTYVNDRSIQETSVGAGDRIKVGNSVFQVEAS